MTTGWEEARRTLEAAFTAAAHEVRRCNPDLYFMAGGRTTEKWPFDCWAEFKRRSDPNATEDIVLFFGVRPEGTALRATFDISTGEGMVLADGPEYTFSVDPAGDWEAGFRAFVAGIEPFIEENLGVLRDALC